MSFLIVATACCAASLVGATTYSEDSSLLQKYEMVKHAEVKDVDDDVGGSPFVIGLRRESVPVYRRGKIASFKTSYSGVLHVGTPAQEFRVVFDTGSGNIVLPAVECKSEACLVETRRRFNMSASSTAAAVNQDNELVAEGDPADQVTIGFGTGEITGEFARDRVCFGAPASPTPAPPLSEHHDEPAPEGHVAEAGEETAVVPSNGADAKSELCVEMSVILAVEMSTQPFKTFRFDGILGLGLDGLAMNKQFSAFEMILGTGLKVPHFGVFLTEGEDGDESEIAFGGADMRRTLEPLSWAPVSMPELGYWQIEIVAVRINGIELDVCKDGTCRGVVDTGTSHLGIPAPADKEVADLLTTEAGDTLDCRLAHAPEMEIELRGYNITLHPFNYMRRLPLREGVSVSSAQGVHLPDAPAPQPAAAASGDQAASAPAPADAAPATADAVAPAAAAPAPSPEAGAQVVAATAEEEENVKRFCRPRLMPVRLPAPLGPKLFILGEPVLHRYYTVYDWKQHRVGFSLANNRWNTIDPSQITDRRGSLPKEVDMLLMQQSMVVSKPKADGTPDAEESVFVQVKVRLSAKIRRCV